MIDTRPGPPVVIEWTRPLLERFKQEYEQAVKNELDQFAFYPSAGVMAYPFVISYAKYLIEYLEPRLPK